MKHILNVMPVEFAEIRKVLDGRRYPDDYGVYLSFMRIRYGVISPEGPIHVVVRKDVPSIPWLSTGVNRWEVVG